MSHPVLCNYLISFFIRISSPTGAVVCLLKFICDAENLKMNNKKNINVCQITNMAVFTPNATMSTMRHGGSGIIGSTGCTGFQIGPKVLQCSLWMESDLMWKICRSRNNRAGHSMYLKCNYREY